MAEDEGRRTSSSSPHGGLGGRHNHRAERSYFSARPPYPDESPTVWTQFSGMPRQPGSPTSLHEWLQSVDDDAGAGLGARGFPNPSSPAASPRSSPLDQYSAADFLSSGIGSEVGMNSTSPSSRAHHFDFGPVPGFGSPADMESSSDYPLHSQHFSNSHISHTASMPADVSRLPPADFSHPPPDFSYGAQPDFSHPPPSFLANLPPLNPPAEHHQSLSDFLASCSAPPYTNNRQMDAALMGEGQFLTGHSGVDIPDLSGPGVSVHPDNMPGHVDVTLPPPNYTGFSTVGDDILFQGSFDMEGQGPSMPSLERPVPPQKKIQRQNSEPVNVKGAAEEGKAMYAEALRRLNSFGPSGPSYEPFGSVVQPAEDPVETKSTFTDDTVSAKPVKRTDSTPKELLRPSYSDVAKASKGKPAHSQKDAVGSDKAEGEVTPKGSTDTGHSKLHRPQITRRQFTHTRIINQRAKASAGDGSHGSYMQPNSRYGLDQFEDLSDLVSGDSCSGSVESLNSQLQQNVMRRNSNCSLGSGGNTSAVEDGHFSKSVPAGVHGEANSRRYSMSGKDIPQDKVYNNDSNITTNISSGQQSQKVTSSNPAQQSAHKLKSEKLFFDPKRIFQTGTGSKAQSSHGEKQKASDERSVVCEGESVVKEETVLNNGKPINPSSKTSAASHRKADYINNDLREGSSTTTGACGGVSGGKRTNQTAAFNRHNHGSRKHSSKDSQAQNGAGVDKSKGSDSRARRQEPENNDDNSFIRNIDWVLVDEWMKYITDCSMTFARNSFSAVLTLLLYLLGVIMYLAMGAIHLIAVGVGRLWAMVKSRCFKSQGTGSWTGFTGGADAARKRFGLEENIALPSTGEEAMKRLLACKGKDPYSILGLRADAADDDIKRYYRRQAVLVHPDKNQEPGAEEAFKILGHAFEMIGEPTKRKEYDAHIFEASEAEAAMREFSDLLTKLQEKVQEAANMMRCDHCGGKHRRIPVDRAWYSARFCDRCNIHHSAKEGDVWAESSMLGFLWHYYACMENNIYDITEWVSCQRENFKHMKANAHPVFYRIQTDSNRRHRQGQSGEADLEDFINRLFNKASMSSEGGASHPGWQFPSQQTGAGASQSSWGPSASSASASSNSKRSRRKKKRN